MKDDVFLRYVLSQPVMIFEKQYTEIQILGDIHLIFPIYPFLVY